MRAFSTVIGTLAVGAALAALPASAQPPAEAGQATSPQASQAGSSGAFDLRPDLAQDQFEAFIVEFGSFLRFRQVGDAATLGRGEVEITVQAGRMPFDDSKGLWNAGRHLGRSVSYPQVVARFGAGDRVDLGLWGGVDPGARYGLAGFDTKIAILKQRDGRPVSVSIRPSLAALIYPSEVLAGTVSVDLSVSRAFGPWSPYAGVAASTSGAVARPKAVELDPVSANRSLAFAGLAYCWRTIVFAGEVESGRPFTYAFRVGARF